MSGFPIFNSSDFRCESHCVAWGNRDDSLKTLPNGHVGWVFAPPLSRSIWIYDGKVDRARQSVAKACHRRSNCWQIHARLFRHYVVHVKRCEDGSFKLYILQRK